MMGLDTVGGVVRGVECCAEGGGDDGRGGVAAAWFVGEGCRVVGGGIVGGDMVGGSMVGGDMVGRVVRGGGLSAW